MTAIDLSGRTALIPASPLVSVAAGAAIFVTVLSLNLIGDALRDVLDPRMVER